MKEGSTLQSLSIELKRQHEAKRDFIASTTELKMEYEHEDFPKEFSLRVNGHGNFGVREVAHEQTANRLGIPQKYYDRMKASAPNLLVDNVNHWFRSEPDSKMVRTLDGKFRSLLSSRYRPLDNMDLAEAVLPSLSQPGMNVESAELTERRLYIKVVTSKMTAEVKKGDVVQAGIVVSNSEIGMGSVKVEPMVYRLVCTNGMIASDYSLKKYHVGRGNEADGAEEFFRDETRRADDNAFWMKVRDVVSGAFRRDVFDRIVNRLRESTGERITGDPVKAVEVVQKKFGLNDGERSSVLSHLISGGDLSRYGMVNAITRSSQDVVDYDKATDLERLGGAVLELPRSEWSVVAEAR